jgi:tetratricopeptide (TPR) repeat protein
MPIAAQNWEEALASFNNALKTYPRYARALNAKGAVLAFMARLNEAESTFRQAIELDPRLAESHFNLGKLLLESNRQSEAKSEFALSLDLGYENPSAVELLVQSMLETHDEDSAVSVVRSLHWKHIRHAPGLHLEIGSALERVSKPELAIEQYSVALKENPMESDRKKAETALLRLSPGAGDSGRRF